MDRKKFTFLVEVIYEQIYTKTVDDTPVRLMELAVNNYSFSDDNRDRAYNDAVKEMDRILRYGMHLKGGAILKSTITPASIKQVGIVDLDRYEMETAAIASETQSQSQPPEESIPNPPAE